MVKNVASVIMFLREITQQVWVPAGFLNHTYRAALRRETPIISPEVFYWMASFME